MNDASNAVLPLRQNDMIVEFDYSDCESKTLVQTNQHDLAKNNKKRKTNKKIDFSKLLEELGDELKKQLFDPKSKNILAQRFFTISLLEYTCYMNRRNEFEADVLYKELSNKLVELNLLPGELFKDTFKPIRYQYNRIISQIFQQQNKMPPQITYGEKGSRRLIRSQSIDSTSNNNYSSSLNQIKTDLFYSRYAYEFTEIKQIGSGGFGKVFLAKNNLDGNEYAVKKIFFRKNTAKLSTNVLREIQFLSKFNHKNIVSYHNCWLENVFIPLENESESNKKSKSKQNEFSETTRLNDGGTFNITSLDNDYNSINSNCSIQPVVSLPDSTSNSNTSSGKHGFFQNTVANGSSFSSFDSTSEISQKILSIDSKNKKDKNYKTKKDIQLTSQIVLFIQMKLCDCTLKHWLLERNEYFYYTMKTEKVLDGDLCLSLFRQILEGVSYIHSNGIIHRDLKPGNILLVKDIMQIKIGDFGLACNDLISNEQTLNNDVETINDKNQEHTAGVGTSLYSSPEQLNMKSYDCRADMYSLGIILYELYQPFKTDMEKTISIDELKKKQILQDYIKIHWPKQCEIINQLVSKDKNKRPSALSLLNSELFMSQEEVVANLRQLLNEKNLIIENLKNKLKEKNELLEQQEEIIRTICGLKI